MCHKILRLVVDCRQLGLVLYVVLKKDEFAVRTDINWLTVSVFFAKKVGGANWKSGGQL